MRTMSLLVDAGHVYAEGSRVTFGQVLSRSDLGLDGGELVDALVAHATSLAERREGSGQVRLLRTLWYDAAPDRTPTAEHRHLARHAHTKVRLGRLADGRQKGSTAA